MMAYAHVPSRTRTYMTVFFSSFPRIRLREITPSVRAKRMVSKTSDESLVQDPSENVAGFYQATGAAYQKAMKYSGDPEMKQSGVREKRGRVTKSADIMIIISAAKRIETISSTSLF